MGSGPVGIAVGDGAAWVANNLEGSLSRIDVDGPRASTARTLDKDGGAYGVAARGGDVWVSNEHAGTLMRVTTAQNFRLAATVRWRGAPLGLALRRGRPVVHQRRRRQRAAPRRRPHHGRAGRRYTIGDDPPVLDPTIEYDERVLAAGRADQRRARRLPPRRRGRRARGSSRTWPPPCRHRPTAGSPTPSTCARGCATPPGRRCWPVTSGAASNAPSSTPTAPAPTTTRRRSWARRPAGTPRRRPSPPTSRGRTATCARASSPTTGPAR